MGAKKAMTLFDDSVDVGIIILTKTGLASNPRNGMAWSHLTEKTIIRLVPFTLVDKMYKGVPTAGIAQMLRESIFCKQRPPIPI